MNSVDGPVLNDFVAVETEGIRDCLYYSISNCLSGNGHLKTALRFATVATIIQS